MPLPLIRHLLLGVMVTALGVAPTTARAETSIERAARTGELALGVYSVNNPPYVQTNALEALEGYAIDVAGLIAAEVSDYLDKTITVRSEENSDPQALFDQVHVGKLDLICGAQFTWEREMFVDYSMPFALSGIRLLSRLQSIDGRPETISTKRIGVIEGGFAEATIKSLQPAASLTPVASFKDGIAALQAGRIDAMAGDTLLLGSAASAAGFSRAALVPTIPYNRFAVGCVMPENNSTLRNLVNLAVAKMLQGYINGMPSYKTLVNRWLGPESSIGLPEQMIQAYFQSVLLNYEQIGVPMAGP